MSRYDLVIAGAGPAGANAARTAAEAGLRVALLDRQQFPRYKTCGGGITGVSRRHLPAGFPVQDHIHRCTFTHRCGHPVTRRSPVVLFSTVDRSQLDQWLAERARRAGAEFRPGVTVKGYREESEGILVDTDQGVLQARFLLGAEGTSSRIARQIGVMLDEVDLGLEQEIRIPAELAGAWRERIQIDWGPVPGSYGWLFPKGEIGTVGVIGAKRYSAELRDYLRDYVRMLGLADAPVVHDSGHLTRCRTFQSPFSRGRALVAGDAAGLLEPFTREGISYALRSGANAADCVIRGIDHELAPSDIARLYADSLQPLVREMTAGRRARRAFEKHPRLLGGFLGATGPGFHIFREIARGESTVDALSVQPGLRHALAVMER